jgi:aminoglycoside phosphotransferase (APT) family kinase protein
LSGGRVERAAAESFLAERYEGRASAVVELRGGDWSSAFSFRVNGRDLVARFGVYREDFDKDRHAMTFARPDLPVPDVIEIGEALSGAYAISVRHLGVFLETLDEARSRRVFPAVLRALDTMRELPVPPHSGCGWGADGYAPGRSWPDQLLAGLVDEPGTRVSGWRAQLAASPDLDALFRDAEQAFRSRLDDCPDIRHVLHVDLLNRNVLVSDDARRLEAVFDWGCSLYGDFLYEVAWLTFWAPWHPGLAAVGPEASIRAHYRSIGLDVAAFATRLACYELHIALTHLAYCSFAGRPDDLTAVANRTRRLLEPDG